MFLNCLLLDLTVIDLMCIVHMEKIRVEIAKNFEMRTSEGCTTRAPSTFFSFYSPARECRGSDEVRQVRGGVFSDFGHPRTRGEGGQKRANFCGRPLWMAPFKV